MESILESSFGSIFYVSGFAFGRPILNLIHEPDDVGISLDHVFVPRIWTEVNGPLGAPAATSLEAGWGPKQAHRWQAARA